MSLEPQHLITHEFVKERAQTFLFQASAHIFLQQPISIHEFKQMCMAMHQYHLLTKVRTVQAREAVLLKSSPSKLSSKQASSKTGTLSGSQAGRARRVRKESSSGKQAILQAHCRDLQVYLSSSELAPRNLRNLTFTRHSHALRQEAPTGPWINLQSFTL